MARKPTLLPGSLTACRLQPGQVHSAVTRPAVRSRGTICPLGLGGRQPRASSFGRYKPESQSSPVISPKSHHRHVAELYCPTNLPTELDQMTLLGGFVGQVFTDQVKHTITVILKYAHEFLAIPSVKRSSLIPLPRSVAGLSNSFLMSRRWRSEATTVGLPPCRPPRGEASRHAARVPRQP